jgi:endonuclease-3
LDFLRKENLSKAVQTFQKFRGVSPFVVSYVAQNGLGGHSIPIDRATMSLFYVLGIVSEDEAVKGRVPGLERTIAKAKGVEFFNLVHQLAVAFMRSPFNTATREKLLKIEPSAKERFPKRGGKKKVAEKAAAKPAKATAKAAANTVKPKAAKVTKKSSKPAKKAAAKPAKKSKATKKATKKVAKKKKLAKATKSTKKKSPTKRLSKKKPR